MFHRKFGSKKVINICNSLGFCASYKEATLYEASATFAAPPEIKPGTFVQFVHDNKQTLSTANEDGANSVLAEMFVNVKTGKYNKRFNK